MMNWFFPATLLFSFLFWRCNPSVPTPVSTDAAPAELTIQAPLDTASVALAARYEAYFAHEFKLQQGAGAAVALVKDGRVILLKGYGYRDAHAQAPVDTRTVFRLGSLSKGFTGILAGVMAYQKKIRLDDKVVRWLPEFQLKDKAQAKRLEVWHLLSHTTGLPYHAYTNMVEEGLTKEKIVADCIPNSAICGKEGEFYAYQNVAFSVAGTVMEKATGVPFAQLIQQNLFTPLNMRYASADYAAIQNNPNKALPHQWSGWNWVPTPISEAYYNVAEAGGVNASIEDMGKWLLAMLGERPDIVPEQVLETAFLPLVKTGNERRILGNWVHRDSAAYGLGWRVLQRQGRTIAYHSGYVNGFRGEIAVDRQRRLGICVLYNGQIPLSGMCVPDFFEMAD